jgi:CRISPR-associated protein Cas1
MELIVEGRGTFLGKHQGRLRVSREQKMVQEVPLIHLERVIIVDNSVAISSDVVRVCSEEGIPIHFLSSRGQAIASLYSAGLTGTVLTRRAQLLAYENERGVIAAKAMITGKVENQANLIRYIAKYRKETDAALYEELSLVTLELRDALHEIAELHGTHIEQIREQLMAVEGRAAQKYWEAIGRIVPADVQWPGREHRGAIDPFNSMLNYGYGILYGRAEQALTLAGLDPYGGFVHADRPGKPSLTLDFVEEFRQPVVDRTIIGMVNKHFAVEQDEDARLKETTRLKLAEKIKERLESSELYEKKRQTLRFIIQNQARHLASFLRGEREQYEPFLVGW